MRIKEGFTLRTICGQHVVVGEGIAQVNFNTLLSFNDSAAWLWEQVQGKEFTEEDLAALLGQKYEVEASTALADSRKLVSVWKEQGILEE